MKNSVDDVQKLRKKLLDQLIGMPKLLNLNPIMELNDSYPRSVIHDVTRRELQNLRESILNADENALKDIDADPNSLSEKIADAVKLEFRPSVAPAINAAGVILHTSLGRAALSTEAQEAVAKAIKNYCTIAIDRETGKRGDRHAHVEKLLAKITGAESAVVVNNNAAATMLVLNTLGFGKEVVVSRGQLVEIGGSFRIPDIMKRSGCEMIEVGTTNKTHLKDYVEAITERTALILRVHASNYQIIGFSSEVPLSDLVSLGKEFNLPVMDDIGSGCLIDFPKYGLPPEPRVQDSVKIGVDIITFSGDKILGGPQSGIIVGKKKYIDQIKKNPLTRALRCGKLTYSALEATLKLYLDEEHMLERLPVLQMLTLPVKTLAGRARTFRNHLKNDLSGKCELSVVNGYSQMGSGSLPAKDLESKLVSLKPLTISAEELASKLRANEPPIFSRISGNEVQLDFRTIHISEIKTVEKALKSIFSEPLP